MQVIEFLSTPSVRRATCFCCWVYPLMDLFLSTPSARRATVCWVPSIGRARISIHALREEGDYSADPSSTDSSNFYPRPPRGGRRSSFWTSGTRPRFLSTPSARRATAFGENNPQGIQISIHALREEGDVSFEGTDEVAVIFLSTPSARRATTPAQTLSRVRSDFYPRPPRGGRQLPPPRTRGKGRISIHALREEGDESTQKDGVPLV